MTIHTYEVAVYGATPGGIGAAIAASRRGRRTVLLEPSGHIGGLMTSGLGRTDIMSLDSAGSVYREFAAKVVRHYSETYGADSDQVRDCNGGLWFEPSVAARILKEMMEAEAGLDVYTRCELVRADVADEGLREIGLVDKLKENAFNIQADVFIDATYEGDLAAAAGVPYDLGRESRDVWNEEYAGKLYMNFDASKEVFPGSTGEGDDRIQAYNFRLCLTQNPDNRIPFAKPEAYSREPYASLAEDAAAGRIASIRDVMNMLPVPNGKTDCNNHHYCMCSTDFPEENGDYPEGGSETREAIIRRHREYIQGLLWFLQNDEALPEPFRREAGKWGYAADEFGEYGHFPPQIYVREARRIRGEYTFTENDARLAPGLDGAPMQFDSVAVGHYPIDSHATSKREPAGRHKALEGFLGLGWITEVYQIPYGVIVPQRVDGLLVPVAVSASHMGFGTIRMEPCWMQLGFAAGVAADLSIAASVPLRNLSVDRLQDALLAEGQLLCPLGEAELRSTAAAAAQYFGSKGFFAGGPARLDEPLAAADASRWIAAARSLEGGRALPALPATDRLLPAGADMGPRLPKREPSPRERWAERPMLAPEMARRWLAAASRALALAAEPSEAAFASGTGTAVTRGEFAAQLYALLRSKREQGR
ncbi:FAD-dependent oxidoreductase [Paenibacillus ginsengarvi]|uniref:FAD-dependent oxidoreductase n=1 Tax=Paenibacillus ginsengarvi TaxID=400777 RepID=A0A3B0CIQ2_9BACL|nr:FAD-dependent oxidoreductase [Paenibacillus ginsengarvi]RKN85545.1 FAD-dependent oxidoreductase [Paenibacillus ginsengarvi]